MPFGLVPGAFVKHPQHPEWGIGQVQSVIGGRVTVNFEHMGKRFINNQVIGLVVIGDIGGADGPDRESGGV